MHDFAADCVEVLDAKYPAVELRTMRDRTAADMDYSRRRGIGIGIGLDFVRGVVTVGTLDVDRARQESPARYGSGVTDRGAAPGTGRVVIG